MLNANWYYSARLARKFNAKFYGNPLAEETEKPFAMKILDRKQSDFREEGRRKREE